MNLIPQLSVTENIFLGREIRTPLGLLDSAEMNRQTQSILEKLNVNIRPQTLVHSLKVGDQQLVEIAKALLADATIILMDEPTSALSDSEIENLHGIIRDLKEEDKTIVYISHKMEELFRIADHFVVLRDGVRVGEGAMSEAKETELIRMMVGRDVQIGAKKGSSASDQDLLKVTNLSLRHPVLRQQHVLENISFSLKKGEILGIFGLMGAGRTELLETIFGLKPKRSQYQLFDRDLCGLEGRGPGVGDSRKNRLDPRSIFFGNEIIVVIRKRCPIETSGRERRDPFRNRR